MTGFTLVELVTAPGPIPLPLNPDLSRSHDQAITAPVADAPSPIRPELAGLAGHREKELRELRKRELDLAVALREPLPDERRPDARTER